MINLIVATSKDSVIGVAGKLPWNCPEDMKFFRDKTINTNVIMGRKTFESLHKPLPKRNMIVISSKSIPNIETFESIELALEKYKDAWIIGGGQIYKEAISKSLCDNIYLNRIDVMVGNVPEQTVTMPWIDPTKYCIASINEHESKTFTTYHYLKLT